jgi:long-chain acyl-CoA synthetase
MIFVRGAEMNVAAGIREFSVATPSAIAVIDGERTLNYVTLNERVNRVANMLLGAGVFPGHPVAFVCGNRLEYPEVAAGCARAGLPLVPINPRLTSREIMYQVQHSGAQAIIFDVALADTVVPCIEGSELKLVLAIDGGTAAPDYEIALGKARTSDPGISVKETDPFCIAYTSGTTGRPKGVLISHRCRCLTFYCSAIEWGLSPGRTTVAVAPLYHGAGFAFAFAALHTGGKVAMLRHFDPENLLSIIDKVGAQTLFLVPTHARMLQALGDDAIRRSPLDTLETLYFNAAPLPQELKNWLMGILPDIRLHELYGSTELGVVTDLRPEDQTRKTACVGPPWFMTEIKILGTDGQQVQPGEKGELYSRSPFLMNGYLNDDAATRECSTDDGYVSAGDVATIDEDGYVYILDRTKDMIISGGVNVYPREIEEVLIGNPQVVDVAVIGEKSAKWGEQVSAFIVVAGGRELDTAALQEYCGQSLAGFKIPRIWRVVNEIPRNTAGKILKSELRIRAEQLSTLQLPTD